MRTIHSVVVPDYDTKYSLSSCVSADIALVVIIIIIIERDIEGVLCGAKGVVGCCGTRRRTHTQWWVLVIYT